MCFSNLIQVRAEIDHWLLVSWVPGEKTSSVHCNLCDLVKHVNLLGDESYLHIEFTYLSIPNTYIILYLYIYKKTRKNFLRETMQGGYNSPVFKSNNFRQNHIHRRMSPHVPSQKTFINDLEIRGFPTGNLWESIGIRRLFKTVQHTGTLKSSKVKSSILHGQTNHGGYA